MSPYSTMMYWSPATRYFTPYGWPSLLDTLASSAFTFTREMRNKE